MELCDKTGHSKLHCTRNLLLQWNNPVQQRESSAEFLYTPRLLPMSKMRHIHRGKALIANHMIILWCQCSTVLMLILTSLLWISMLAQTLYIRYLTQINYLFQQSCRIDFPQVATRHYAGARAALRKSPVRRCVDRPCGNVQIVRGSVQSPVDERGSVCTWLKTGIGCWILAVTLALRLYLMVSHSVTRIHATFSILMYIFDAVTKLAQLHKRLHDTSGFRHFPHKSAQNSCLDSSARYCAENPSTSAQISVSARARNLRNSSEKCKLSMSSTVLVA